MHYILDSSCFPLDAPAQSYTAKKQKQKQQQETSETPCSKKTHHIHVDT
jgi:hypothetical protein